MTLVGAETSWPAVTAARIDGGVQLRVDCSALRVKPAAALSVTFTAEADPKANPWSEWTTDSDLGEADMGRTPNLSQAFVDKVRLRPDKYEIVLAAPVLEP
jgi:hypothetical protein